VTRDAASQLAIERARGVTPVAIHQHKICGSALAADGRLRGPAVSRCRQQSDSPDHRDGRGVRPTSLEGNGGRVDGSVIRVPTVMVAA
jgi:hypothetical protein